MELWEFALAASRIAHSGIVIDREAVDACRVCGVTFRRKNAQRHYWGHGHGRALKRAWHRDHAATS